MTGPSQVATSEGAGASRDAFEALIDAALDSLPSQKAYDFDFNGNGYRRKALDVEMLGRAAQARGLDVARLAPTFQLIRSDTLTLGFCQNMPWTLSALDRLVTNDKQLTKRILAKHGLPVASGDVVDSVDDAIRTLHRIGRPVVVKPLTGSGGKGITVDVRTEDQLRAAFDYSSSHTNKRVLVEECVPSIDVRVFVVAGRAVAAMMRVPAHVVGDGRSSIAELVEQKNAARAKNPYHNRSLIELTDEALQRLARRKLSLDSIPPPGRRVFLHYKANMSSGGDGINVTDHLDPGIARLAEQVTACFATAHHAGVDILVQQLDRPPSEQKCVVCEVNCNNDVPIHEFPHIGDPIASCDLEMDGYFFSGRRHLPAIPKCEVRSRSPRRIGQHVLRILSRESGVQLPSTDQLQLQLAKRESRVAGDNAADSPRLLDQGYLRKALSKRGWGNVRYQRRLILATYEGRDVVVDRSHRSMFAAKIVSDRRAQETLLASTSVPFCRRSTFARSDLDDAASLFEAHPGPWTLRAANSRFRIRPAAKIRDLPTLERAWARISKGAARLVLEQAPDDQAWRLLLVGGEIVCVVGLCRPSVIGDGEASVAELVARAVDHRRRHPYLRHFPMPRTIPTNAYLAQQGMSLSTVLTKGKLIQLSATTHVPSGASTLAYEGGIDHSILSNLRELLPMLGNPQLLATTFAQRRDAGEPCWSLLEFDVDPVLAEFAVPGVGLQSLELYERVATLLVSGQRYEIDPIS